MAPHGTGLEEPRDSGPQAALRPLRPSCNTGRPAKGPRLRHKFEEQGNAPVCRVRVCSPHHGLRDHDCLPIPGGHGALQLRQALKTWRRDTCLVLHSGGPHSPLGRSLFHREHPSQNGQPLGDRPRRRAAQEPLGAHPSRMAQPWGPQTPDLPQQQGAPPMICDLMEGPGRTRSGSGMGD